MTTAFSIGAVVGLPRVLAEAPAEDNASEPVDILLVTSGCCHDYDFQTKALQLAFKERGIAAKWTVVAEGGTGTKAKIALYDNPDWAKGFDLVIHNECFAGTKDPDYIRRITKAHYDGVDAMVIHCAMHTYRDAKIDDWREFLGVTSRRHDHKSEYPVTVRKASHPIMKGVPKDYTSANDELYIIEKVWPNTEVLATSPSEKDQEEHAVFWTNRYGKANVFGTTYGHSKATFKDKVFLDVLANAVRWLQAQP
ncbi:MAG: ThuA domain-containing protein [Planctomycetota bacterium]